MWCTCGCRCALGQPLPEMAFSKEYYLIFALSNFCYDVMEQFFPFITRSVFLFLKPCRINTNAETAIYVFIVKHS